MIKNKLYIVGYCSVLFTMGACTQTTPSMMNDSPIQVSHETTIQQIPVEEITQPILVSVADHYKRYGDKRALDLTMTFDPKSKDFTAMKAVHTLKDIQERLKYRGVHHVKSQTLSVPEGRPSLIVSYNTVAAHAPSDCDPMPGLANNKTDRDIGAYKFGCGIETLMAKQIYRPADLYGNDALDSAEGRREAAVIDGYNAGVPREALDGIEREDLSTE